MLAVAPGVRAVALAALAVLPRADAVLRRALVILDRARLQLLNLRRRLATQASVRVLVLEDPLIGDLRVAITPCSHAVASLRRLVALDGGLVASPSATHVDLPRVRWAGAKPVIGPSNSANRSAGARALVLPLSP